jgi:uncharacterized protein (DUF1501 family)
MRLRVDRGAAVWSNTRLPPPPLVAPPMLTIHHPRHSRRRFLTVGGLALGSALPAPFAVRGQTVPGLTTGRAVVFVFQQGGPSQFETFDPKPDAPAEMRTVTGVTRTAVPGVSFADCLPRLAALADKLCVVRSFATGNAGHNLRTLVGPESLDANVGALVSRVVGATHPTTGTPTNAVLFPQAVCPDVAKGAGRGDIAATGSVGPAFAPFVPGGGGQLQKDLRLALAPERFGDRRALLEAFDNTRRNAEGRYEQFDREQKQACEVLLSGIVADALDLTKEDPRTVARYDTAALAAPGGWAKAQRGQRGYYAGHAKSIGKALLLARRLVEAGCGFVTVHTGYEGVWDVHGDGNNLNAADGAPAVGRPFDHAVAAFVEDCEARGLSERVLLMATGEMGRTPRLNRGGGRDHWSKLAPLVFYGGGAARGRVVGRSTRDGGEPDSDGVSTPNLISTVLHTAFDMGQLRLRPEYAAISRLGEAPPIPGSV